MKMNEKLNMSGLSGNLKVLTVCLITTLLWSCNQADLVPDEMNTPQDSLFIEGFSPDRSASENRAAMQKAIEKGGTFYITEPGDYMLDGTVYLASNTRLVFGKDVRIVKDNSNGDFSHVFLNRGALTRTYNSDIELDGLNLVVNGVDKANDIIYGLRGQVAFFYAKNIAIRNFRCHDLEDIQFCIHVCTFDSLTVDNVIIEGKKDGVHLGNGKNFHISNCSFRTGDDAIAINAHDYITSTPELGNISDGIIENCIDYASEDGSSIGYFSRILAGAWTDWTPGMTVRYGDTVISNGMMYRLKAKADGTEYTSTSQPNHTNGEETYSDGLTWIMTQRDLTYTAAVSNVTFRNITLQKPRPCFSFHFDNDYYSRGYYPGAEIPSHHDISFENIDIQFGPIFKTVDGVRTEINKEFMLVRTPVDKITVSNSTVRDNTISFSGGILQPEEYGNTEIVMDGCTFDYKIAEGSGTDGNPSLKTGPFKVLSVTENVAKEISFTTTNSKIKYPDNFKATFLNGGSNVTINSDIIK